MSWPHRPFIEPRNAFTFPPPPSDSAAPPEEAARTTSEAPRRASAPAPRDRRRWRRSWVRIPAAPSPAREALPADQDVTAVPEQEEAQAEALAAPALLAFHSPRVVAGNEQPPRLEVGRTQTHPGFWPALFKDADAVVRAFEPAAAAAPVAEAAAKVAALIASYALESSSAAAEHSGRLIANC